MWFGDSSDDDDFMRQEISGYATVYVRSAERYPCWYCSIAKSSKVSNEQFRDRNAPGYSKVPDQNFGSRGGGP